MPELALNVPRPLRRGGLASDEQASVESGRQLIRLMCRHLGRDSLEGLDVLDVGCGTKLVQAILSHDLPVGRYVGLDVFEEMIEFLNANVNDPRFSFFRLNTRNENYNPAGEPLSADMQLPVEEYSFDLICLFSVFTHLAPHDYVAMLKVLRRYIKPEGKLIYSLFVNEATPGGYGLIDSMLPHIEENMNEENFQPEPPDFLDWMPKKPRFHSAEKPLWRAVYSRKHALELVEGTGWDVESLNYPEEAVQHYILARPA